MKPGPLDLTTEYNVLGTLSAGGIAGGVCSLLIGSLLLTDHLVTGNPAPENGLIPIIFGTWLLTGGLVGIHNVFAEEDRLNKLKAPATHGPS